MPRGGSSPSGLDQGAHLAGDGADTVDDGIGTLVRLRRDRHPGGDRQVRSDVGGPDLRTAKIDRQDRLGGCCIHGTPF